MIGYPLDRLFEEVAYIAYHFNWSFAEIMNIEHRDRQQWLQEIAGINRRINENNADRDWKT